MAILLRPGPRRVRAERAGPEIVGRGNDAGIEPETGDTGTGEIGTGEVGTGEIGNPDDPPDEEGADTSPPVRTDGAKGRPWLRWGGRFERPQLMVIIVIAVIGLLLSGWAVLRARPVELADDPITGAGADPTTATSAASAGSTRSAPAASSPAVNMIKVHVLGAVRRSGVYELPDGSRIEDALKAAGGLARTGALGDLNLAQPLTDGQQIFIAKKAGRTEVRDPGADGGSDASRSPPVGSPTSQVVNLNTASVDELDQLPGVGPVTAAKIMSWREANGRFSSVAELQEVDGIGPKTFAELEPLVTV